MDKTVLGVGVLNWHPDERRIDRYGVVHLTRNSGGAAPEPVLFDAVPVGAHGQLVAVIVGTQPAPRLGALARGADQAAVGDTIPLGTGTLFVESSRYGTTEIGVSPDDGRNDVWLSPAALYRCYGQTVRLEFYRR